MKRTILLCSSLLGVIAATPAEAGLRIDYPVRIGSFYAYGSMGSARNSADTNQYLTCYVNSYANGYQQGGCLAVDSSGSAKYCYFDDNPTLSEAVRSVGPSSWIAFTWYEDTGECWSISVENTSLSEPPK